MRTLLAGLVLVTLAGCGSSQAEEEEAAVPRRQTQLEAGVNTANTAQRQIEDAQAASQARIDSQMSAAVDTVAR